MAERKQSRISNAEIKAGIFLTFCLALFVAMLMMLGSMGHSWRGRQELKILFARVGGLHLEAPVRYNGLEIGHVRSIDIVHVTPDLLTALPQLSKRDLDNLPLNESEREELRAASNTDVDKRARAIITDRCMVLLTLSLTTDNDTQRFKEDDQYRILGSMLGDSFVAIKTGNGHAIGGSYGRVFLGLSGDMYSDLGKSLVQVKDIMGSMADLVNGGQAELAIRGHLAQLEGFSSRIEKTSDAMASKIPDLWDRIDGRITDSQGTMDDVEKRVANLKPKLSETFESTRKSIEEIHKNGSDSAEQGRKNIADSSKRIQSALESYRKPIAEYKDKLPGQVRSAREWSDRFAPTAEKINVTLSMIDQQLNQDANSTHQALQDYVQMGAGLEAATYRMKRWPWSYAHQPEEADAAAQEAMCRHDLARRQYLELRDELETIRESLKPVQPTDAGRIQRVEEILHETDTNFDAGNFDSSSEKKRKR